MNNVTSIYNTSSSFYYA